MTFKKQIFFRIACHLVLFLIWGMGCRPQKKEQSDRLLVSGSPYVREHADNPIDWYPWGQEALDKAKKEGKPLLITIGYMACHWCHVMEEESFKDTAVASFMNKHFVPVVVDREERPDIDLVYLDAVQLITGNGGWPLNAFALPDGRPFHAVTYLPKESWLKLLKEVASVYEKQPAMLERQADELTRVIATNDLVIFSKDSTTGFTRDHYLHFYDSLRIQLDPVNGGLSGSPKFPLPVIGEFLLQAYYFNRDQKMLRQVEQTLDAMERGGIYDQAGGGFFRYATDKKWKIPHFEKMLYDNAQLISLYAHAFQVNQKERYRDIIRQTLSFADREMAAPEGGYFSSLDADTEGEEGRFYIWTQQQFDKAVAVLKAAWLKDYYNISMNGNWEDGRNILYRPFSDEEFALRKNLKPEELNRVVKTAQAILQSERATRKPPARDKKIITSWNALMLKAMLDAGSALQDHSYLEKAENLARFLEKRIDSSGRVIRTSGEPQQSAPGFLDDYANLASAYIDLYERSFDMHWLQLAKKLVVFSQAHFFDSAQKIFYYSSDETAKVVARKFETTDQILPSSNAVMAGVLYRLGVLFDKPEYLKQSETMVQQVLIRTRSFPEFRCGWGFVGGLQAHQPWEIAIMGTEADSLSQTFHSRYLPDAIFMGGVNENLPLLENKGTEGTTIYVCRNKVCKRPVHTLSEAFAQMK